MSVPFGKYKGHSLHLLPDEYVLWLAGFDNSIDHLAETVMLNQDFDACAKWIRTAGVETTEECKETLTNSFRDGVMPDCIVGVNRPWWFVYLNHRNWIYRARDEFKARGLCAVCLTPLVPIGTSRKNGYKHHDWAGRIKHKQCWRNEQFEK